ncbi:MAG: hypothetical protein GX848_08530 [Clostridiales bacterium]|nr:hypothetical protein [Clostridiales bacterium]
MDFQDIAINLYQIATTASTLQKELLLKKYASVDGFKDVLKFIYNPYFTTGLKEKKLERVDCSYHTMSAEELMEYLSVNTTGTDYDATIANAFIYQSDDDIWQWAATGLVTKDLQIGVSITTLNKVYGNGFIPKIGIMRGTLCPSNINNIYLATEKIDGNRRLIMTKPTGIEIYTRSGKRDYGLVEIEEQASALPVGFVFDTECIAVGDFADNIELRQASASILNSRGKRSGVKALCFDVIPQEEYDKGISRMGAFGRKATLAALFGDYSSTQFMRKWFMDNNQPLVANSISALEHKFRPVTLKNIECLPILGIVCNYQEAIKLAEPIWETGGEGIMLVEWRSPYEVSPNPRKTLLKVKATKEYVLRCCGVHEGDNKYAGMLGAIEVEYRRPGDPYTYPVKVGSGFPDYLRIEYWENPEKIIGKLVEIESFGESRNAQGNYSLNCPIFKRIRGDAE